MRGALVFLLGVAVVAQAPQDSLFRIGADASPDGTVTRVVIEAQRQNVPCLDALRELAVTMDWELVVEPPALEAELAYRSIDLDFVDRQPQRIAHLIAVACGADIEFDNRAASPGKRPVARVRAAPDGSSERGRDRMRVMAEQWYRSLLADPLRDEPHWSRAGVDVRMKLGHLLYKSGDLRAAMTLFTEVFDARPNESEAASMLMLSQCHFDLALADAERSDRLASFAQSERWARQLLRRTPNAAEVVPATLLLGRALLGSAGVADDGDEMRRSALACASELGSFASRATDSPERLEAWLMVAEAEFLLDRVDRVHLAATALRQSAFIDDLTARRRRAYLFLVGFGALGVGEIEIGVPALEQFVELGASGARVGIARVLLAESFEQMDRPVEARLAAIEVRERYRDELTMDWRRRADVVWARTALAVGARTEGIVELERIVACGDDPRLALFLAAELLVDQEWERAVSSIRGFAGLPGSLGDRVRQQMVVGLYQHALAAKDLENFPPQAIALALRIEDSDLMHEVAQIIGDAYTSLGKLEQAADAYQGFLW